MLYCKNTELKGGDGNEKRSTFQLHVPHVPFRPIKLTDEKKLVILKELYFAWFQKYVYKFYSMTFYFFA